MSVGSGLFSMDVRWRGSTEEVGGLDRDADMETIEGRWARGIEDNSLEVDKSLTRCYV